MGERTATLWTCDKCGRQHETTGGGQPSSWGRVDIGEPPRTAEPDTAGVYCPDCMNKVRRLLGLLPKLSLS